MFICYSYAKNEEVKNLLIQFYCSAGACSRPSYGFSLLALTYIETTVNENYSYCAFTEALKITSKMFEHTNLCVQEIINACGNMYCYLQV